MRHKTEKVEEAVGMVLAHDITEIRPGEFKGPAFRKGHKVERTDLCRLLRLGKRHLFIVDLDQDQVYQDEAAQKLAQAVLLSLTTTGFPNMMAAMG